METRPTTDKVKESIFNIVQFDIEGRKVLDLFGGSGSTLICCEMLGRQARLMELDPRFADVIVKRWQDFTGLTGVLEGDGRSFAEVQAWRAQDASQAPPP